MKCPQARQSVRNQPRMIGPSSATVIHTQPDPARRPGNDPHRRSIHISGRWPRPGPVGDDSIGATNPRRHPRRNPPCTRSPPPRGTRRHARRVPRQPGQEPAQGAGDPTGCSSGTINDANDIPVGRPNKLRRVRCSTATPLPIPRGGSSCPTGAPNTPSNRSEPGAEHQAIWTVLRDDGEKRAAQGGC